VSHVESLEAIPLFAGLAETDRQQLALLCDAIDVPEGLEIIAEGEPGYHFFAIAAGTADVFQEGRRVGILRPGDFFGEMALVEGDRRSASVRATGPMRLVVLSRDAFWKVDRELPDVADRVRAEIAQRRAWNQMLAGQSEDEEE
jgi:CRP-like cAMP-binding protein